MHPGDQPDYVQQRDFERYTDAQDKRWDAFVVKVDSLASSALISVQRINTLESLAKERSSQSYTTGINAAQAAAGCVTAIIGVLVGSVGSLIVGLLIIWLTHK